MPYNNEPRQLHEHVTEEAWKLADRLSQNVSKKLPQYAV
jgi:hypothetical protein